MNGRREKKKRSNGHLAINEKSITNRRSWCLVNLYCDSLHKYCASRETENAYNLNCSSTSTVQVQTHTWGEHLIIFLNFCVKPIFLTYLSIATRTAFEEKVVRCTPIFYFMQRFFSILWSDEPCCFDAFCFHLFWFDFDPLH